MKWGVLGLCDHGLPYDHTASCTFRSLGGPSRSESAEHWRTLATAFVSLVNLGAEINQGRGGSFDDCRLANYRLLRPDFPGWDDQMIRAMMMDALGARDALQILIRRLLTIARVQPLFAWNRSASSWAISLDAAGLSNLLGILTVQLMLTIAQKEGFALCSSCHRSYIPLRKPDPGRRSYCPDCGLQAAWRDAARERRKRAREAKSTLAVTLAVGPGKAGK